jgi:toxin ParE1/3/4
MIEITFSPSAIRDLHSISRYLSQRNPVAAQHVGSSIRATINQLAEFPELGRRQRTPWVRKLIEAQFGYLIFYRYRGRNNGVTIIAVKHPAMKRMHQDD